MTEFTVASQDPLVKSIIERFNQMGVNLIVEQDEKSEYRVRLSPAVYVARHGDNSVNQIRPYFRGASSPVEALKKMNDDVLNMCMKGTSYIYGQCRLLVEDEGSGDLKVYEIVDRMPLDTGNTVRLVHH